MVRPLKYLSALVGKGVQHKVERERLASGGEHAEMTLVQHVMELRKHVVRGLLWLALFVVIALVFMDPILAFLRMPFETYQTAHNKSPQLLSIGLFEVVVMNFKICLVVALVACAPFLIRELWKFVSPALYENERRIALPVVFSSVFLFYAGVAFGFFVIVPAFLGNTLEWASQYANVALTVENYFNSLMTMVMLFGIIFEVPVIMSLLGLAGVITSTMVAKNRRIVILASFVIGALISPPDVFSQTIVSVPLWLMCEVSVIALKFIEKNRAQNMPLAESLEGHPPA